MHSHPPAQVSTHQAPPQPSARPRQSRRAAWVVALILFAFLLVYFWPVLMARGENRMHIGGDLLTKDYPFRLFALRELLRGRLPLWDEHLFGGWPGLANTELALLYPPNLFLVPFWSERGFSYRFFEWWILLHLYFAGLGTALLGRRYGLSAAGSLLAGTVMMCSGFLVAHKIHSNIIQTITWLPWILLCLERFLGEGRRISVWLAATCLACAYFGGHPQMALYLTLVVLARVVWEVFVQTGADRNIAVRRCMVVAFAILVAALITMIQWLPARDLVAQGERARPTFQSSAEYSLPLGELVDAALPESTQLPGMNPGIEVFYWGITALFVTFFCWPVVRLRGPAGFFLLAGTVSLLFALGKETAAHRWAFDFVPGIAWLRASSRWMVVVSLAMALAAGRGLDAVTRDRILANPRAARVYGFLACAIFFCFLFLALLLVTQRLYVPAVPVSMTTPLLRQLAWILLCLVLVTGALTLYALGKLHAPLLSAAIILMVFWDLASVHGDREIEPGPGGYVWDEAVETILADPSPGRVKIRFGKEGSDRRQYNGEVYGLRELDGESPLRAREYLAQRPLTSLEDPARINHRYLDLLCTEYILTDIPSLPNAPWRQLSDHLWHNPNVSPPVRWYGSYLAVDPTVIPWLLSSSAFPYDQIALVGRDRFKSPVFSPVAIPGTSVIVDIPLLALSVSQQGIRHQALILVDGVNYSKNSRGYNIVVVDPKTDTVAASDSFDTYADFVPPAIVRKGAPENTRMARFLDRVPDGHIVIAAVREEGTNILQQNAVRALQRCGSGLDLRKRLNWAHAMVGVKGAPPGTALEVVSATEALVMSTPDGSWLRHPQPPSPPEVAVESHYLNARAIWDTLGSEQPLSLPPSASYRICDGTALLRVPLVVFSSPKALAAPGFESDKAGLIIGASDWSPNRRGYNIAAYDPLTDRVLGAFSFDLSRDWDAATGLILPGTPENSRMTQFLRSLPAGTVVIGAIRDEACNILQPETVAALGSVGCELDLRKKFRWAHAFIGVKGARQGSAIEIASTTHVIIHTVVRGPYGAWLNDRMPTLDPIRRTELLEQGIPVLMSEAAKRLGQEDVSASPPVPPESPVFQGPGQIKSATPSFPTSLETDLRVQDASTGWSMVKKSPEEIQIVGSAPKEGILFMSESFFPGWHAYLDGEETEIFPVFRFFRALRIPAGAHTIEVVYRPMSVFRGAVLSCLGGLVWAGWGVWLLWAVGRRKSL